MAETKFLDKAGLTKVLENANAKFSKVGHTHTKSEITDFAHNHDDRYYTESEIDTKVNTLNSAIAGKAASGHNHNDTYYTKTEMNTKLASKSDTSHSHTTHLTTEIAASTDLNTIITPGWYKCSASVTAAGLKNAPTSIAFAMEVLSNAGTTQKVYEYSSTGQKIYTRNLYDGTWGAWARVYTTTNKPTLSELGAASSGHTHNYAGSSSAGGSANSAVKLDSSAGSATQPVYFSNGVPVATTYTLGKSVPDDAKFTDTNTHYASKNVVGSSTATSNTTTALTNGNVYINSVENGAVTSAHKISGSGATTVTTDTSGNIVISSTAHPTSLKNPNALTISLNGTSQGAYDGSGKKDINITASNVGAYTTGQVDQKIKDANDYTDTKISNLINGAPETLDTLGEIATAMKDNEDVVAALNDAIGTKANSSDLNTHIGSNVHITSTERSNWNDAYAHAVTNKGGAFGTSAPGLYKITTNAEGHVTAATAVAKSDITALGVPAQDTAYTHPTTSGNKHIPAGGASGQILRWSADGTATWGSDNNTWIAFKGATTDAAGTAGYAPAPAAGAANRYLRSDGTWVVPPNATYSDVKGATSSAAGTHGLVPAPAAGSQAAYLRGDGTWAAFSKSTVGLGNVDNTADANKSVKYATSAGSANSATSASTAGSATKATQDSAGQQINTTYIKGLSVSGRTITYTKGDGTTGTITTQDTNTTYAALTNDEIDACFTEVFG